MNIANALGEVAYRTVRVGDLDIFYREAGPKDGPTILLLHGLPSSSRMYQPLLESDLASQYHLVAPDYPGFGHSSWPDHKCFAYTFDHLAKVMQDFTEQLHLDRYTLFMQDYGGPVGFRMALAHPERIQAMIVQNAVSHEESLSPLWAVRRSFWHAAASARASCTKRSDTPRITISDITVPAHASPVANEMIALTTAVVRAGKAEEIPLQELAPGDIVTLCAGDMIPADVRIWLCRRQVLSPLIIFSSYEGISGFPDVTKYGKEFMASAERKSTQQPSKRVKEVACQEPKPLQAKSSLKEAGEKMKSLDTTRLPLHLSGRLPALTMILRRRLFAQSW